MMTVVMVMGCGAMLTAAMVICVTAAGIRLGRLGVKC